MNTHPRRRRYNYVRLFVGIVAVVVVALLATSAALDTSWAAPVPDDMEFSPQGLASLGDTVWEDLNDDGDQDAGELGIENVQVNLYQDGGDGIFNPGETGSDDISWGSQVTDGSGKYLFEDIDGGTLTAPIVYWVEIDDSNFADPAGPLFGKVLTSGSTIGPTPLPVALTDTAQIYLDADFGYNDRGDVLEVIKDVVPLSLPEPGGDFTFNVTLNNSSTVVSLEITSLVDDKHGDLNNKGTCSVPQTIATGGSYNCSFTVEILEDPGFTEKDTVIATGVDDQGNPVSDSDDADVEITDVPSLIEVIKTADPTEVQEPGDTVTFTVNVENASTVDTVTITLLDDDIYGDITDIAGTTCAVPQILAPGEDYECEFQGDVEGNAGETKTDVVTASGTDDDGNDVSDFDDADVEITDVDPVIEVVKEADPTFLPEPGGTVTFSVEVTNLSNDEDPVTITLLDDDIYGDLNGQGTCAASVLAPITLLPGESYDCEFDGEVTGNAGETKTDVVTASGTDDEGNPVTDSDDADVEITGTESSIQVIKDADPTSVPEPGGPVTFSVEVINTSSADTVYITSLTDDIYGNLNGEGTCAASVLAPITLLPGENYECEFQGDVEGNAGETKTDVVTAEGEDDDNNPLSASDDADVDITDVDPVIEVIKEADPTFVPEPGGTVTFSVEVTNLSNDEDPVTITLLDDDIYGDLNGQGTCAASVLAPITLLPGESYDCEFDGEVTGNAGETKTDVVTASGTDDDGNDVSDFDDADVEITDVDPVIEVVKEADPTFLPEPGGTVTFSVEVTNLSNDEDPVTITLLDDDIYGDLNGQGTCAASVLAPITLLPGESYDCEFDGEVTGNAGETKTDVVTASGTDDEGNPVTDSDDADVEITGTESSIQVIKDADPTSVPEPGGPVTFSVEVINTSSADTVYITSLTDDIYGNLNGEGTCAASVLAPITLLPGENYECEFQGDVEGNAGETKTDVVTAEGEDDDNNPLSASDDADVDITDVDPVIEVIKEADPTFVPEPGGTVTFSVEVTNLSNDEDPVTITSLDDDIYGNLNGQGTCIASVVQPIIIDPGDSYTCSFSGEVTGNAGETKTDVVTASGTDDEGNPVIDDDDADVLITDVESLIEVIKDADPTTVPEPGGTVTFSVEVINTSSADTVFITSLTDDVYGNLNGKGTCAASVLAPITLAPGENYQCQFQGDVEGNAGETKTDVVTAEGEDDDGNDVSDSDDADVDITDVDPVIEVIKDANPTSVAEPGGTVIFFVEVKNDSNDADPVRITSLEDDIYGNLNGQGSCAASVVQPIIIDPGDSYTCSFSGQVTGNAGDIKTDVVTAAGTDDEGNPVTDSDEADVEITDVDPMIEVVKVADPTFVEEPGATVTFSVVVRNTSLADTVTITSLVDDVYGNLNGEGNCSASLVQPIVLAPSQSYSCEFDGLVTGDAGDIKTDVVVAVGTDDDNNPVSASDDAEVEVTDAPSSIMVIKTANPSSIQEPGGDVSFSVEVVNTSVADTVTITSLIDDIYGNLNGQGTCFVSNAVPRILAPGESYNCVFTELVIGNGGDVKTDVVIASGYDDDGAEVRDEDDADVDIIDVDPVIEVIKTANPTTIKEPGGPITFSVVITNNSGPSDPVTITSLDDNIHGDLTGLPGSTCFVPRIIAPGSSYQCSFTANVTGSAGDFETDIVTATGFDDERNPVSDDDDATVTITPGFGCVIIKKVDDRGAGLPGWNIHGRPVGEQTPHVSGYTDGTGYVSFDDVPSGKWNFWEIMKRGWEPVSAEMVQVEVSAGLPCAKVIFVNRQIPFCVEG